MSTAPFPLRAAISAASLQTLAISAPAKPGVCSASLCMSDKVGNISYYDPQAENQFSKPYSEGTAKIIDEEVKRLIDEAYTRTIGLLTERRGEVEKLAEQLLEKEVLFQSDVEALIGPRPYEEKKPLSVEDDHHHDGGISEGVPPYDPNVTNQQPAAK